jgi:hypothetical protein
MGSTTLQTVIKMLESLPEPAQELAVERLRDYIQDLLDESQWDAVIMKTQNGLVTAAQKAKRQIVEGQAQSFDFNKL